MCFTTRKEINKLKQAVEELTKYFKSNEYARLKTIENRFETENESLRQLQNGSFITVKSAKYDPEHNVIVITYNTPQIVLGIDENGDPEVNNIFKAINTLDFNNSADINKIFAILQKAKKNN